MKNGEFYVKINCIKHWCKVSGSEHNTIPLVIIHGGPGGNNYVFERTVGPYLEKFSTVIYYEQRGCGRSEAPVDKEAYSTELLVSDLAELCHELKLGKIIPLGYSFGGELALEFSAAHPKLTERLIVQAPSNLKQFERNALIQLYGFYSIAHGETKEKLKSIMTSGKTLLEKYNETWDIVDTDTVDRFLFKELKYAEKNRSMWRESGLINTGLMFEAVKKEQHLEPVIDKISGISCPILFMVGLHDRNVGVDMVRDMASRNNRAMLVIFSNSAHFPDIEETEKYSAVVKQFITYS